MLVFLLVAIFGLCISIFNYLFQKDKYNRLTEEEVRKQNKLSSPAAWLIYFFIFFITLLLVISYYVYSLFVEIFKMQQGA